MNNARISFFVFYQNDGTFAEWNVDHKTLGSKGGIFTKESITSSKYSRMDLEHLTTFAIAKILEGHTVGKLW